MRRPLFSMMPALGLLALAYPVSAAAPGVAGLSTLMPATESSQPLILAQGEKGAGGGGGSAKTGGGGGGGSAKAGGGGGGGSAKASGGGGGGGARASGGGNRGAVTSGGNRQSSGRPSGGDGARRVVRSGGDRGGDRGERRGKRFSWGDGFDFYFYDGYYHGDCSWLRRRYRETGSAYWLARYRQCRDY